MRRFGALGSVGPRCCRQAAAATTTTTARRWLVTTTASTTSATMAAAAAVVDGRGQAQQEVGEADMAAIRAAMAARPRKAVFDALSPMPSHLLSIALSDAVPAACLPAGFSPRPLAGGEWYPPFVLDGAATSSPAAATDATAAAAPALPQGHHLVHFPPQMPASRLLGDGTDPAHAPGPPYVRRMWAGGAVSFAPGWDAALRLDGRHAVCVESVGEVRRAGTDKDKDKVFVDVWRRYGLVPATADGNGGSVGGGGRGLSRAAVDAVADEVERNPLIEERRTLVFLRAAPADAGAGEVARSPSRVVKDYAIDLVPSQTLLFHFSALTYNAHAIHLDRAYCRDAEGHRGLLVHGPLSLALIFAALRSRLRSEAASSGSSGTVRSLEYRNLAPLYAGEPMRVCLRRIREGASREGGGSSSSSSGSRSSSIDNNVAGQATTRWDVWVEGPDGGLAVRGSAMTIGGAADM